MKLNTQDFIARLSELRRRFSKHKNIVKIGFGAKQKGGVALEECAFRFYVNKKLALKDIAKKQLIPSHLFGIQTDVIAIGTTQSLVTVSNAPVANEAEYRDEGIRGGITIRNQHFDNDHPSGYGTLGVLARRKSDNALVGITCSHVANSASESLTTLNTRIGQPKYYVSCCCCPRGWIGDIKTATLNQDLDCALIEIDEDIEEKVTNNNTEHKIEGIPTDITGAALPYPLDPVKKYGRATGLTTGKVIDNAFGPNQILIELTGGNPGEAFAHHGDSGAVVLNEENQVIALLVASYQETISPNSFSLNKAIATLIKPVMIDLGITIAGVDAADVTFPVRPKAWPGGQTDPALNPVETFTSENFGLTGNVDWTVTGAGAVITETNTQTANNRITISVRYDNVSASQNKTDAIRIIAKKGANEVVKMRTVFKITPRINTNSPLDANNTKRFNANGGTDNQAGVSIPGTDGASWFMAKAEIIYDILPTDIQWNASGLLNFVDDTDFVNGGVTAKKGDIIARRETKFNKGQLEVNARTPTRTIETDWISAGISTSDDFQEPTTSTPNSIFRLANEALEDPNNLLQAYSRADYRDFLEMHDGTSWKRITPFAEWFANLTADFNGPPSTATAPPNVGATNNIGVGNTVEPVPNIIYCGFVGNRSIITKTALVNKIVEITEEEHENWRNIVNNNRLLQNAPEKFSDLVIYCLAVQLDHNTINPTLIAQIQNEVRGFPGLTRNSNFTTVSNTISRNLGGANNDRVALRIRRALNLANRSTRDTFPWSAVFITHCVRQAALDLEIEHEDNLGVIQGRRKILEFGNSHSQYSQPAFVRRNNNTEGCYQAFEPDQAIEVGDIIIQDRRTCLINPGDEDCPADQRVQIDDIREFNDLAITPPTTHGDLVVEIDNATNSVITIGGNTGDSVRRRRFPINNLNVLVIDNVNRRTWTQEPNNGNDPPNTGINNSNPLFGRSTSRIFAVLKLVEECQELPE